MKNKLLPPLLLLVLLLPFGVLAQPPGQNQGWQSRYRATPEKVNDLVHTKLEATFNYQHSQLIGKVWLTLKPHFYPVDSVQLDAKKMDIQRVSIMKEGKYTPLTFTYDSTHLNIRLGKKYTASEAYTLYIEYTANPNRIQGSGSAAISSAKGLYFINPTGTDKNKPTQIWTQGETESNSVWIPIIDKPNQKTTQEMILTVPENYITLSNGKLVSQKNNKNGTRTDTWKMDEPHAPYLFFIGVGDYAIVRDTYKGKEVNYYVERSYQGVARKIFGDTPAMMQFFSEKLGIEYPWVKYSQITARDYVSGAMENTTATLHGEWAQQNARQLTDGNSWEPIIAHELFHQWFGDYVTCESWSNLTMNEGFATLAEGLWQEHKYGKDEGQAYHYQNARGYLANAGDSSKSLVRYYYADKEDMFDAVSYNKGGAVLNMLRTFVGEAAFYESLKLYLTRNRFGTGNAREVQQAFEDVTGKDLHWFFDQWFFGAGHPVLDISYHYDETMQKAFVYVSQKQISQIFKLPICIDVYEGDKVSRHFRWIEHRADTFYFTTKQKPALINVDAEKTTLAVKRDHKSLPAFIHQYQHANNYVDRREAIEYAATVIQEPGAMSFVQGALKDPSYRIRWRALNILKAATPLEAPLVASVEAIAKNESVKIVKSEALLVLQQQQAEKYKDLFVSCLTDSSYQVAGTAYSILIDMDREAALAWLPKLKLDAKNELDLAVKKAEILTKTDNDFDDVYATLANLGLGERYQHLPNFLLYLKQVNDVANFKRGVDLTIQIRDEIIPYFAGYKDIVEKELLKVKSAKEKKKSEGALVQEMEAQIRLLDEVIQKKN